MSYIIRDKTWRVDRRVPVLFFLTLALQIAVVLIWAAQLDVRVGGLEKQNEPIASANDRLSRIEERIDALRKHNEQIKHKLDYLADKMMK